MIKIAFQYHIKLISCLSNSELKQISFDSVKYATSNLFVYKLSIWYMHNEDLALNNQQDLKWDKPDQQAQ